MVISDWSTAAAAAAAEFRRARSDDDDTGRARCERWAVMEYVGVYSTAVRPKIRGSVRTHRGMSGGDLLDAGKKID